jgi:hypothetical protein
MTPFQSLRATIDMLLARAREPVDERKLVPAPSRANTQRTRPARSRPGHLHAMPMRRRHTDWPPEHAPLLQRIWQTVKAWGRRHRAAVKEYR